MIVYFFWYIEVGGLICVLFCLIDVLLYIVSKVERGFKDIFYVLRLNLLLEEFFK